MGFLFSLLFRLGEVISAILAMRILVQFVGQAIGLVLLRSRRGAANLPFRMPLYPLPVVVAIAVWLWLFYRIEGGVVFGRAGGPTFMLPFQAAAVGMMALGTIVFLLRSRSTRQWPFAAKQ